MTIEKCSSPTGDGNELVALEYLGLAIEKCSSPTGDGNELVALEYLGLAIEKCSSPTGDGNCIPKGYRITPTILRNVVPRQGTETCHYQYATKILTN